MLQFSLQFSNPVEAESIRGEILPPLQSNGSSLSFSPYDLIVIEHSKLSDFQEGLEVRIDIPPGLREYRNSFVLLLYKGISPVPGNEIMQYNGLRAFMRLLPSRESTYIRIPYEEEHAIKGDPFTDVLPFHLKESDFPLMFTLSPVAKGIPDPVLKERLSVSVKALLRNEGSLRVVLLEDSGDDNEKISIVINEQHVDIDSTLILPTGSYKLRATSTHAYPVEKSVAITAGAELVVNLGFDYGLPELTVIIPKGVSVSINNAPINTENEIFTQSIEPGEHTIEYRIGNLDFSRGFTVSNGDRLRIELKMNIDMIHYRDNASITSGVEEPVE